MQFYFTITKDNDGYRARFYSARNGRLIWWTEGYANHSDAVHAITLMRGHAATAPLR